MDSAETQRKVIECVGILSNVTDSAGKSWMSDVVEYGG